MLRGAPATLCTVILLAALAGCGGGSSGSPNADPASLVPSSAPLYVSVAIKPAGDSNGPAYTDAKALSHLPEPYGNIAQALLSAEGAHLEYKRDIEPWIGNTAGVFVTSFGSVEVPSSTSSVQSLIEGVLSGKVSALGLGSFGTSGAQGAIVLATANVSEARSFLSKRAGEQHAHTTSYRGVSFDLAPSGAAEGIVKGFTVIGSEEGLKQAVDTSLGGPAITSAPGYSQAPAGAVASAYVAPQQLDRALPTTGAAHTLSLFTGLFSGAHTVSLSLTPSSGSISLQGEAHYAGASKPLLGGESAKALGELPGGSWLAAGVGNVGANLPSAFALLASVGSLAGSSVFGSFGGPAIEKVLAQLKAQSASLQRDFGWARSGAMFVSGTGLFNLEAGLVISSSEPAASRAAVGKLAALMRSAGAEVADTSIPGTDAAVSVKLQGFPAVIFIADGQGKLVMGIGQQSIEGALSPSSTLSTSPSYSSATSALGGGIEPSVILEFPTLLGFLEGIGLTQSPGISNYVPYLKSLGTLSAGASESSGVQHFRAVLSLS